MGEAHGTPGATLMAVLRVLNVDLLLDGPLMTECGTALSARRGEPAEENRQ